MGLGREQARGWTGLHTEVREGVLSGIPGGFAEGRGGAEQRAPNPQV